MGTPCTLSTNISAPSKRPADDMATKSERSVNTTAKQAKTEASNYVRCPHAECKATVCTMGICGLPTDPYLSPPPKEENLLPRHTAHVLNQIYTTHRIDEKSQEAFIKLLKRLRGGFKGHSTASYGERIQLLKEYKQRPAIYLTGAEDSNPCIDIKSWLEMERPDLDDVALEVYTRVRRKKTQKHGKGCTCFRCWKTKAANDDAMAFFGVESDADEKKPEVQNENQHAYIDVLIAEVKAQRKRDGNQQN